MPEARDYGFSLAAVVQHGPFRRSGRIRQTVPDSFGRMPSLLSPPRMGRQTPGQSTDKTRDMTRSSNSHIGRPPIRVELSVSERAQLEELLNNPATGEAMRRRYLAILMAADGRTTGDIAGQLGISASQVSVWRRRFAEFGFEGILLRRLGSRRSGPMPKSRELQKSSVSSQEIQGQRGAVRDVDLTDEQVLELRKLVQQPRIENRLAQRARAVLLAHRGLNAQAIGERLDMASPRVLHWCRRYLEEGIGGLADRPRSGRPRKEPGPDLERLLLKLAEEPTDGRAQWSRRLLARELGMTVARVGKLLDGVDPELRPGIELRGDDSVHRVAGTDRTRRLRVQAAPSPFPNSVSNTTSRDGDMSRPSQGNAMLMLSGADVARCLPMDAAVDAMRTAFTALAHGRVVQPVRSQINPPGTTGISLVMPAWMQDDASTGHTSVKVVSVYPDNAARGEPVIHGLVLLVDASTGKVLAGMDGGALTAIRTGAVAGLATDLLAPAGAGRLAVLGAGVQARTQAEAVSEVRRLERINVYSPTAANVARMIDDLRDRLPDGIEYQAASSAREALADSDIVCCATTSATPVFADRDLEDGVHVNAVGVFQPDRREVPAATVTRAKVYVDDREAMMEEAGDLLIPLADGTITEEHVVGSLGDLLTGRCAGRASARDTTFFKSVGLAVQDTASAGLIYARARELGIGTTVPL